MSDMFPTTHLRWFIIFQNNDGELDELRFTNDEPLTIAEALGNAQVRIGNDGVVLTAIPVVDNIVIETV